MATPSIQGLFGGMGTPEEMQRAMLEQKAAQFAEMNQNQQLSSMAYKGGANLGQGLAGAFGVDIQDPTIQRATRLRQLASQYNTNTAQGLRDMAASLQATDPESAFQLTQRAMAMDKAALDARKGEAEITLKEAETTAKLEERKTPDQKNAYDIVSNDPLVIAGSPQFKKNYVETLKALTAKTITAQVDKVGVAEKTREPVYFDKATDQQFTVKDGKRIPFSGGIDQTTAKTNVSVDAKGEAAFVTELGKLDAKAVSKAYEARGVAVEQLGTLKKMAEVADRPIISGSLAEQRTNVANFFNSIGLASNKDQIRTANSQEYIKYSTGLVLDNLKKTGYNPSNADMKVVQSIIPRLETDPMARKELIKFMSERANDVINETTSMDVYARKNKGLSGYKPTIPQVNFNAASTTSNVTSMSTEDLLKIAKGQK